MFRSHGEHGVFLDAGIMNGWSGWVSLLSTSHEATEEKRWAESEWRQLWWGLCVWEEEDEEWGADRMLNVVTLLPLTWQSHKEGKKMLMLIGLVIIQGFC